MGIYVQEGNSITVPKGSTVFYSVSADGYEGKSGTIVANVTKTVTVELEELKEMIFTISALPENAIIEFEVVDVNGTYTYTDTEQMEYTTA